MQGKRLEPVLQEQSVEVGIAHTEPERAPRPLNRDAASEDVLLEIAAHPLDNRLLRRLPHPRGPHGACLRLFAGRWRAPVDVLPPPVGRHAVPAEDVDEAAIRASRALHVGTISLISEPSRSAMLHAIDRARAAGCLISCDPNLRLAPWPDAAAKAGLLEAIAAADVVKISDDELLFLTGSTDPGAARSDLWQAHHRLMVVTLGASGCVFIAAGATGMVGGFSVASVDATGAGDAFVAGLLDGLLADPDALGDPDRLRTICRLACAVGALTTTERGAIPALPTRQVVERFLEQSP